MEATGDLTFTGQVGKGGRAGIVNFHFAHINNIKLVHLEYKHGILSSSCRPAPELNFLMDGLKIVSIICSHYSYLGFLQGLT